MKFFDETFISTVVKCFCCFSCIRDHRDEGCARCAGFINTYFAQNIKQKVSKAAATDLTEALEELFDALQINTILVEDELEVSTASFIKDFMKNLDEIKAAADIVDVWHIDSGVADKVFMTFEEVIFGGQVSIIENDTVCEETDSDSDDLDLSSDSDNDHLTDI